MWTTHMFLAIIYHSVPQYSDHLYIQSEYNRSLYLGAKWYLARYQGTRIGVNTQKKAGARKAFHYFELHDGGPSFHRTTIATPIYTGTYRSIGH